jgi:predicted O-linked N-acetylglucosamine transferase (SPINDLY family)
MFLGVSDSPHDQLLCSRTWARDKCPASPVPIWKGERYRHDRIRVAYLSADFRMHPMSYLIVGLFEHHDRGRFETIGISFGPDDRSEIRTRVKGAFEDFIDVRSKSDLEVARLMRELEVDIAVDLMGYTQYDRMGILALRPAPVQVSYIGFPGTMGADFIDYILADRFVIPEEHHACYTEKVVYLPDTYLANDSKRVIADRTPARAEAGLPEQGFVFCSFNNNYKISPPVFDVWMRLLDKVEGSVLWLLESNAVAVRSLRQEAANRGIAPERLVFAPIVKVEEHLARHRLADLFLDTLPYNAHTTACDALWAGLPVVTCLGTTFVGRVAASLLNAIGLNELITRSLEEYEALALELATNRKRLAGIKSKLAQNRETYPLFDTDRFRRHIEAAYTTMWERSQRGQPPESFAVAPIDN